MSVQYWLVGDMATCSNCHNDMTRVPDDELKELPLYSEQNPIVVAFLCQNCGWLHSISKAHSEADDGGADQE